MTPRDDTMADNTITGSTMADNLSTGSTMAGDTTNWQFVEGMPVYDAGGDKVGTISEHNVQGRYLIAHKGWLFPQDVYIPLQAVASTDADGVYLNLYKDDILNQDWSNPPAADVTSDVMAADTGTMRATDMETDEVRVPVREEELVVGKQEREIGRVHLHKDVVEEEQTITEPVTREQVRVEHVGTQGDYTEAGPDAFVEKDIDVPVMGEEIVTGKRAVVKDEVRVYKEAVTEDQQVSDTVRKERVTVDGADELRGEDVTDTTYADQTYRQNR